MSCHQLTLSGKLRKLQLVFYCSPIISKSLYVSLFLSSSSVQPLAKTKCQADKEGKKTRSDKPCVSTVEWCLTVPVYTIKWRPYFRSPHFRLRERGGIRAIWTHFNLSVKCELLICSTPHAFGHLAERWEKLWSSRRLPGNCPLDLPICAVLNYNLAGKEETGPWLGVRRYTRSSEGNNKCKLRM